TGVDPSSVHLTVNGQDVTGQAQVSDRFVTCTTLPLVDGLNHVTVGVRDRAGNFNLAHWDFTVASLQNEIHKVSFSLSPSHGGERVAVTMDGIAGGDASFDLGSNWLAQPMHEVRPGYYEGVLVLERGDRVVNTPVTGHIRTGDHLFDLTSTNLVTFVDGRPAAPTIDLPTAGSGIQAPLVVAGHADPGVQVHVRIEYDNRALSRIGLRGFSSDQTVTADDTGAWRTGPMSLDSLTPRARHLAYVVSCEALNAGGAASKKVRLTVYRDAP
ncbi:MAG: hypothetical protein LC772_10720, partial [Chloroflexi bacterium]|nr:hypothetical protein [Chloroflexota bacterium]